MHLTSELRRLLGDALLKEHTAEAALRRQSREASSSTAVQRVRAKTSSSTTITNHMGIDAKVRYMHMVILILHLLAACAL
jgi:hypothetical protein